MDQKACSVFVCSSLLISILFFSLTSAGRELLGTPEADGRSKINVNSSSSNPAHSYTGQITPSRATPSGRGPANNGNSSPFARARTARRPVTAGATSKANRANLPCRNSTSCRASGAALTCTNIYGRDCIRSR